MPQPCAAGSSRAGARGWPCRFGAAGAILLLTVSTPHASSEALPTSPDVARTPPGMAGPVVAWSLDDAATACKHEPRIVREHARKADGMARPAPWPWAQRSTATHSRVQKNQESAEGFSHPSLELSNRETKPPEPKPNARLLPHGPWQCRHRDCRCLPLLAAAAPLEVEARCSASVFTTTLPQPPPVT